MGDLDERMATTRTRVAAQGARLRTVVRRSKAATARSSAALDAARRSAERSPVSWVPSHVPDDVLEVTTGAGEQWTCRYPSVRALEEDIRLRARDGWTVLFAYVLDDGACSAVFTR